MRICELNRDTLETKIKLRLNLDGSGKGKINTKIGFLDHMLELFAFHGQFDLDVLLDGDINVDTHHSIEDLGILLGKAFKEAIGDKVGIKRYSNITLPMDETLSMVTLDISGRSTLVFNTEFQGEFLGEMKCEDVLEFFEAFVKNALVTLHINVFYGSNDHHKAEAIFKAFARVLKDASTIVSKVLPSTKGVL